MSGPFNIVGGNSVKGTFTPSGLTIGGRVSIVTIDATSWTPLPIVPLTNRNAMSIENDSGVEIKIQYNPLIVGYVGKRIPIGFERQYDITDAIILYAKSSAGIVTVTIEEIA